MSVVARFYISGYECNAYDPESVTVKLQAVSRGEHNKQWARATPSGSISMTIKNPGAASWLVDRLGREVEVVLSEPPSSDDPERRQNQYG